MKYPYVFFDWDGTLASTLDPWMEAKRQALADFGVTPTAHEIGESFGNLTWHSDEYGIDDAAFNERLMERIEPLIRSIKLYDGAAELLEALHTRGVKMALLTTTSQTILDGYMQQHNLVGYFDFILTSDQTVNHKPHPEVIERAVKHFGANAKQVLMVGDSSKDLGSARAAGVDAVLFHHSDLHGNYYDITYLKNEFRPQYVIEELSELLAIVEGKS